MFGSCDEFRNRLRSSSVSGAHCGPIVQPEDRGCVPNKLYLSAGMHALSPCCRKLSKLPPNDSPPNKPTCAAVMTSQTASPLQSHPGRGSKPEHVQEPPFGMTPGESFSSTTSSQLSTPLPVSPSSKPAHCTRSRSVTAWKPNWVTKSSHQPGVVKPLGSHRRA